MLRLKKFLSKAGLSIFFVLFLGKSSKQNGYQMIRLTVRGDRGGGGGGGGGGGFLTLTVTE